MIKSYLRLAFRNLVKNKVFSGINILGLAIGMAVVLSCLIVTTIAWYVLHKWLLQYEFRTLFRFGFSYWLAQLLYSLHCLPLAFRLSRQPY